MFLKLSIMFFAMAKDCIYGDRGTSNVHQALCFFSSSYVQFSIVLRSFIVMLGTQNSVLANGICTKVIQTILSPRP